MQIVSVAHAYPRSEADVAGAFIERLNVAFRQRHHSVKVVAPADRGDGKRERRQGISVSRVRYAPSAMEKLAYTGTMVDQTRSALGKLTAMSLMTSQAAEIKHLNSVAPVDVVHAHWWIPGGVSAWLSKLVGGPPYVVTLHGSDVAVLKESWIGRWLARRVLRGAAAITSVSSYLADAVAQVAEVDTSRIVVQPMPVDVTRFGRVSRGGDGIVTIGRLTEQKNIGLVLEAVARLRDLGQPTPLKIIGDGPRRRHLEYRARGLQIDDLTQFVGEVSPNDLPAAVADADLMVFPALREGLGLVAAEALMMGIPVIASFEGGGVTDIVPPTGAGRLVPARDVGAMTAAIQEMLSDPATRRLAVETGRSLKTRLEPNAVASVFEGVFESALGRTVRHA